MIIGHYIESMLFYITKLLPLILVIFRMPWLKKYNLEIDFPILELKFDLITILITVSYSTSLTITK